MSRIIGLTGRAGAGKDFVCGALAGMAGIRMDGQNPKLGVLRMSFADTLRFEIEDILNGGDELPVLWKKPYADEVRRLLQWWGTDLRRKDDPDYWVKRTMERLEKTQILPAFTDAIPVFTDVRFPNEANAIRAKGGLIVRVLAPIETREKRLGTLPPEHASETAMDDYYADMHITSTEENEAFKGQVRGVLVEATLEDVDFLKAISESLRD